MQPPPIDLIDEVKAQALDTLIALVENGPLWDGDVPSKRQRDFLVSKGLAAKIVVKGQDGYQAATYWGREVYCILYGCNTMKEGRAIRTAQRSLDNSLYMARKANGES